MRIGAEPLDGMNVWPTISEGKPTPRKIMFYTVEPQQAAVRKGDWKLVWHVTLPSKIELFDLALDPYEKTNVADAGTPASYDKGYGDAYIAGFRKLWKLD